MTGMDKVLSIVLLFIAFSNIVANVLDITPTTFIPGLTSEMTMTCHVGPMATALSQVYAMQLGRRGGNSDVVLVSLQTGTSPVIVATSLASRASVEGALEQSNLQAAYLKLTITDPQSSDEGEYTCSVTAMDKTGHVHTLTFSRNSSIENVTNACNSSFLATFQSELHLLHKQVSDLKASNTALTSQVASLQAQHTSMSPRLDGMEKRQNSTQADLDAIRSQIDPSVMTCPLACTDSISQFQSKVDWTTHRLDNNTDRLTTLDNTLQHMTDTHHTVAFSVRYKTDHNGLATIHPPEVLKFTEILVNEGQGYDPTTGMFTAPITGTYALFLNVPIRDVDPNRILYISLLDKSKIISLIEIGPSKHITSLSVLYNMTAGDIIYAHVSISHGNLATSGADLAVGRYAASFAGYLLG